MIQVFNHFEKLSGQKPHLLPGYSLAHLIRKFLKSLLDLLRFFLTRSSQTDLVGSAAVRISLSDDQPQYPAPGTW